MKNIYQRLKPKIKASIKKDLNTYPATTRLLIQSLQESATWSNLSVDNVQSIISHSHVSFWELSMKDVMFGDEFLLD
tara:strand:+ start:172 stop:402 length:231 start_codon:yes stop_codon:yes gene_type:complete